MELIRRFSAGLTSIALLVPGCMTAAQLATLGVPANYAISPVFDSKPEWRTAVLPPTCVSASSLTSASGLEDYTAMALLRTGHFTLVDRSAIEKLLDEQEFSCSDAVDEATAVHLGRLIGAEAVMTISIGSIVHDIFWADEPAQRTALVYVKIISVETSEVLFASTGEGSSFEGAEDALRMALEVSLMGLSN